MEMLSRSDVIKFERLFNIRWDWLYEEKWRLKTFAKYPHDSPQFAVLLAKEGFIYIGCGDASDDTVVCFFCKRIKREWRKDENIADIHSKLCLVCPMVTGSECGNVPFISGQTATQASQPEDSQVPLPSGLGIKIKRNLPQQRSHSTQPGKFRTGSDICQEIQRASSSNLNTSNDWALPLTNTANVSQSTHRHVGNLQNSPTLNAITNQSLTSVEDANQSITSTSLAIQTSSPAVPVNTYSAAAVSSIEASTLAVVTNQTVVPQNQTLDNLGIIMEKPKKYEYAKYLDRFKTFYKWPVNHHLKKKDLAGAGFYYTGDRDCVRCFYCDGILHNLYDYDDVQVEHARLFPKCGFIRLNLGQTFVDTVALLCRDNKKISFQMVIDKMNIHPSTLQVGELRTNNDELRGKILCKACCKQKRTVVFLPCGHLVCCTDCAASMELCPITSCVMPVTATIRAILPSS
ncbi:Apoptosis inhibitor iap [Plakobranchus ocellatus]|uniref:Apoptosis inhibitor iap n=1 Tax=Plakobranchus ocellatus TaxID=259542 RepID=A0AAV4BFB8_9GAST|nr:Apoptosis inhibitor iap [Plakobranchus ocellatus]